MTDKKTFGNFIKTKRMEKGCSQKELAERLFVTESAVSKWERGISYPDVTLIEPLCRALEITEHELISASVDTRARAEKRQARLYRRISGAWLWVPTICYAIALATCFICNLAVDKTLSWFWVVLASLLCAYSFVPTFTSFFRRGRLFVFALTSLASICLLLFVCGVYTGSAFWVPAACLGTAIGYVLTFLPALLGGAAVPGPVRRCRFIISFAAALALALPLLAAINVWQTFPLESAMLMTLYGFVPPMLCAVICMFPLGGLIKAGICCIVCGGGLYAAGVPVDRLFPESMGLNNYRPDFANWTACVNANVQLIIFMAAVLTGLGLIIWGACRSKK